MSSEAIVLKADPREAGKTSSAKRLRKAGRIPGVLYSEGKPGITVSLDAHHYMMTLKGHPSENLILELDLEGKKHTCLLCEVQHGPVSGEVLHVDFNEVSKNQILHVPVHIELQGEPEGVKAGGVLEFVLNQVDVECTPSNLPEHITLNIESLNIDEHKTVGDLDISGMDITITTDPELVIAQVAPPRVLESDEDEEGEVDAAGEAGKEEGAEEKSEG